MYENESKISVTQTMQFCFKYMNTQIFYCGIPILTLFLMCQGDEGRELQKGRGETETNFLCPVINLYIT